MSEYIAKNLRGRVVYTHVRLGMPPGLRIGDPNWEYERRIKLPRLLEADCIVRYDDVLQVIEFKVRRFQEAVGKLLQYAILIPQTPEFEGWPLENIQLVIVFGRPDPVAEDLAHRLYIDVEQFEPPWLKALIAQKSGGPI